MSQDLEALRAQFETWMTEKYPAVDLTRRVDGSYWSCVPDPFWDGFQAGATRNDTQTELVKSLHREVTLLRRAIDTREQVGIPAAIPLKLANLLASIGVEVRADNVAYYATIKQPIQWAKPDEQSVQMPQNAEQAEAMVRLGMMWLEQQAPDRIKKTPNKSALSLPGEWWISPRDELPADGEVVLAIRRGKLTLAEIRWEHPGHEDTFESFRFWAEPDERWIGDEPLEDEIEGWVRVVTGQPPKNAKVFDLGPGNGTLTTWLSQDPRG